MAALNTINGEFCTIGPVCTVVPDTVKVPETVSVGIVAVVIVADVASNDGVET